MTRPLTARQRAEQLIAPRLSAAGAPHPVDLTRELLTLLTREGIRLVDEPVRPPIGSRRGRYRTRPVSEATPMADGLGPPRGVRFADGYCRVCRHPRHVGRCDVLPDDEVEPYRCSCAGERS